MINSIAKNIIEKFSINKFIETGILHGHTLAIVSSWFSELYPTQFNVHAGASTYSKYKMYEVDIDPLAVERTKELTKGMNNIIIDCDYSNSFINKLVVNKEIINTDNCFLYLDGHPNRAPRNEMLKPLQDEMREITSINHIGTTIISIDDWKVEGKRNDHYSEEDVKEFLRDRTDVIYHSKYPNINKKYSCFIFLDKYYNQLKNDLRDIDVVPVMI